MGAGVGLFRARRAGRSPSRTVRLDGLPSRCSSTATVCPGRRLPSADVHVVHRLHRRGRRPWSGRRRRARRRCRRARRSPRGSPPLIPAFAAGAPAWTSSTSTPSRRTRAPRMPRNARVTRPAALELGQHALDGGDRDREADADAAAEAAPPVAICELTPITWPVASSSGPPELPGLIAASVWMTSSIAKPLGAVMRRCSADTTPVVSVRSRPNGLPIATVGSPTRDGAGVAERERVQLDLLGVDREHARGRCRRPCRSRARTPCGGRRTRRGRRARTPTTCALVRMSPLSSSTKPEPVATFSCVRGKTSNGDCVCCTERARM